MAAVHFKNSIVKFWRSRAPGAISEEEKIHLRSKLLPLLDQEDSQIAVQTAVVLAKVARLDFPKSWPSLFTDLLGRLQAAAEAGSSGTLTARRCYLALHHTLKELSTKRLAADQRTFEGVTSQLLGPLWSQWGVDTSVLIAELPAALAGGAPQQAQQAVLLVFERWLLQLKSLRRMLLHGFPSDSRTMEPVASIKKAAPAMLHTLDTLLRLVPSGSSSALRTQAAAMLARGCLKLVKTLRQLSEVHPWSVLRCGTLIQALELCCAQIALPSVRSGHVSSAITRQCLQYLHSIVRCAAYRGSPAALSLSAGKGREQLQRLKDLSSTQAAPILKAFWATNQEPLVELIITQLFPLSDKELELWEDSGEEFHEEMEHTAWEESIRGCGEKVFLALLEANREVLAPLVVNLLQRASQGTLGSPNNHRNSIENGASNGNAHAGGGGGGGVPWAVRMKAAAYHAVAVGAYEMYDSIDFSSWLHASLIHEAADATSTSKRPLRRAAIKLIAAWTTKLKREDRSPVYRVLVSALADHDPAIHLAAVAAVHALVDDWEFEESEFAEYVPTCFQVLGTLLQETSEFEARVKIFSLISLIIDRLGPGAAAFSPGLLSLLPSIWEAAEGQSLLRIQIMVTLQRIIHVLGADSVNTYSILIPVLGVATDPSQPNELNLFEDGLLLWFVALVHAPAVHAGLIAPLPQLLNAMERSTEHIAVGTRILSSCILLGGRDVLAVHGSRIATVLHNFIGNVKDKGMLYLMPVFDIIVHILPVEGPSLLKAPLQRLLASVICGQESGMVVAAALNVLGRMLLQNPGAFLELFKDAAPLITLPPEVAAAAMAAGTTTGTTTTSPHRSDAVDPAHLLLLATLDLWIDKFDAISPLSNRKLGALALCALLAAPVPGILQRCSGIAACVTSVWFELEGPEAGPEKAHGDYLASFAAPRYDDLAVAVNVADAEGEEHRRRALFDASPVATVQLSVFCKQQMEAAAGVHGGHVLNDALNAMDPLLGQHLQQMLS